MWQDNTARTGQAQGAIMTTRPAPDEANAPEAPSARPPSRAWRFIALMVLVLLAACAYWIVTLGAPGAFADRRFQFAALAVLFLGACLIGRWMMRPLRDGIVLDRRNARLMRSPRANWMAWTGRR